MHWFQDSGRQRSRILYAFRSPSGTRVGRDALDPGLMRQLELQNPGIPFDWKAVLADRQVIEPATELRRRRPKRSDEKEAAPKDATPVQAPTPAVAKVEPAPAPPPRPMIPAAIEGLTVEDRLAFLQHWYPVVRERVDRRASDPDRHAALQSLCDRMNPDGWAPEDVEAKLQQAGEALERLSHVFARRRRRTRRRPADGSAPPPASDTSESS
jgi:hypothetical protein